MPAAAPVGSRVGLGANASRLAPDGLREHDRDRQGQEPPGRDLAVRQQPGEAEPYRQACSDVPVVAHDEVPPETAERPDASHAWAAAGVSAAFRRRSTRVSANETSATYATIA